MESSVLQPRLDFIPSKGPADSAFLQQSVRLSQEGHMHGSSKWGLECTKKKKKQEDGEIIPGPVSSNRHSTQLQEFP